MELAIVAIKGGGYMSQNEKILKYLQTHKRGITPQIAYEKFGCMRLSGRIWDLRHNGGHKISSTIVEVKNRYGEPRRVSLYRLMEKQDG